jgi:hypothetical protein
MLNRASVRIVRDVCEWLSGRADQDAADVDWLPDGNAVCCLKFLLEARENWLNSPDPTLWKTGDAHRLLIDTAAPRLTDIYRLTEHGPSVLRVLFDFLDDTNRFHPGGMRVANPAQGAGQGGREVSGGHGGRIGVASGQADLHRDARRWR